MPYPHVLVRANTEPILPMNAKKDRNFVGHFFNKRRASVAKVLGLNADTTLPFTVKPTDEHLALQRLLRKTSAVYCKRSDQENRKVLRCVDGLDDDDVPREAMGQFIVLVIIILLILFAWLAYLEGIPL